MTAPLNKKSKEQIKLKVRKPNLDYSDVPKHWAQGRGLLTHVVNSLSIFFPAGEDFFIRNVNQFAKQTKSVKLREEIRRFVGQEMQHTKQHHQFNEILKQHGFKFESLVSNLERFGFDWLEPWAKKIVSQKLGLSLTVAAEHLTATWAANYLGDDSRLAGVHETVRQLFLWHCSEELEHKHVAFDLLQEVDGSYSLRAAGMAILVPVVFFLVSVGVTNFMVQDDEFDLQDIIEQLPGLLYEDGSLGRDFLLAIIQYMKPGFHPNHNDDLHLVDEFLATLPQGVLAS